MSSVRPICYAEEKLADGEPLSSIMAFLGLTQGILVHLKSQGIHAASPNWFPTPLARMTGVFFIGGGLFGGLFLGKKMFQDPALQRLKRQHQVN